MNNKISTIIPFLNSANTLPTMLDSILSGIKIPDEIILVDDGSTDDSMQIVTKYSNEHPFIRYIKQEHQGVSAARNLGIKAATGDWISFLDADDYIEPDMYSEMLGAITDDSYDGCICGYFTHKDSISTEYASDYSTPLSSDNILEGMFIDDNIRGFLFTRLFRADIIKGHSFNTKIRMCEDLLFQTEVFTKADYKFALVSKPLYHYVQNSTQATATKNYFENDQFIYKPAFDNIKDLLNRDYVDYSYNKILEFSMYTLISNYQKSNNKAELKAQIRRLQAELKSTPCPNKSKRRILYQYCPILASMIIS